MDTNKTLGYDWEYGHEEVAIRVSSYRNNGNLYVGLCHREDGYGINLLPLATFAMDTYADDPCTIHI